MTADIFTLILVFCAGICAGVSGLTLYLGYLNKEKGETTDD